MFRNSKLRFASAAPLGLDIRYVVTSLTDTPERLYETGYCARGQAENFIKLHKTQLASDRTSCRSPCANQFRLVRHTAACWLLHTLRAAAPAASPRAVAEFATLRLRLIKIVARVIEGAARMGSDSLRGTRLPSISLHPQGGVARARDVDFDPREASDSAARTSRRSRQQD